MVPFGSVDVPETEVELLRILFIIGQSDSNKQPLPPGEHGCCTLII